MSSSTTLAEGSVNICLTHNGGFCLFMTKKQPPFPPKMENSILPNKEPYFPTSLSLCLNMEIKTEICKTKCQPFKSSHMPYLLVFRNSFIPTTSFICIYPVENCWLQCFTHSNVHGLVHCVCWIRGQWDQSQMVSSTMGQFASHSQKLFHRQSQTPFNHCPATL